VHIPSFFTLLILMFLGLSGCDNKEKKTDYVSQSLQDVTVHPLSPPKQLKTRSPQSQNVHPANASTASPTGIVVDHGRIIIDTTQAKSFLEGLVQKMDHGFKKIEHDLKKNQVRSPNDTGITITQDRIEVDLNKTEKFMEKWIKSMESVGRELDNVFRELDRSLNP